MEVYVVKTFVKVIWHVYFIKPKTFHLSHLKWIFFLRSRFWWYCIFDVSFGSCEEDIVTSIFSKFRTMFYIWFQKHSKIIFISRNHAKLLVARRFQRWNNASGCHALLPSLTNLIFGSLHPLKGLTNYG